MSARTDHARRLELSELVELGDQVIGRARSMTVTLQGEAPFTSCVVELAAALPIARLVMRPGDLNHPDAVETGDASFDESMQVTALTSYAPTLQHLLAEAPVRAAILAFFKKYPDAEFNGSRLHVPSAAGVTQSLVVDALAFAETIAQRFATIGFLESEKPTSLPPGARSGSLGPTLAMGASLGAVLFLGAYSVMDFKADATGALVCGLCLVLGVVIASFSGSPDLK